VNHDREYAAWKRDKLPGITCPDLDEIAAFVASLPADNADRPHILATIERVRRANAELRVTAKRCAHKLFELGVQPPDPA
jgi:hypothetical protein